jgi:hypothetical protein
MLFVHVHSIKNKTVPKDIHVYTNTGRDLRKTVPKDIHVYTNKGHDLQKTTKQTNSYDRMHRLVLIVFCLYMWLSEYTAGPGGASSIANCMPARVPSATCTTYFFPEIRQYCVSGPFMQNAAQLHLSPPGLDDRRLQQLHALFPRGRLGRVPCPAERVPPLRGVPQSVVS